MNIYIVWVGGVPMYEGTQKKFALISYEHWKRLGYDDVILEKLEKGA
jgi:hypothetical protein